MASSSRGAQAQVDSFIDDEDLTCPLCVEEFDLSDRNFRPCPCGYQVCQFCYNNIKVNLNGLCPACRRPYDDKNIEWKVVTQEEIAQFKANIQKNAKKKAEQRQKEAQKREAESLNRKHLAGLRVVQKNLVYVVGLQPSNREEDLLQTLRGDKYFGQYGKILKIVVSKAKESSGPHPPSMGVYVTFERKEDAQRCITAVNGSVNGDRTLRAQFGTTKYCSAYLRNEQCTNKNCMFLHEAGDNDDSYSRQDLSSMNSVHTQRPLPAGGPRHTTQQPVSQAPIAAATAPAPPIAAPRMAREPSKDDSDNGDGSALPSSASWATKPPQHASRRGSHATSATSPSPNVSNAVPVPAEPVQEEPDAEKASSPASTPATLEKATESPPPPKAPPMDPYLKKLITAIKNYSFNVAPTGTAEDIKIIKEFPPLWDDQGGARRRALREQQEEARLHVEQESQSDFRSMMEHAEEEEPESGSLQLGGEPEGDVSRDAAAQSLGFYEQRRPGTQPPIQRSTTTSPFGNANRNFGQNIGNLTTIGGRALTPMQQHQLMILKSGAPQSTFIDQFPPGISGVGQGSTQANLLQQSQQQNQNRQVASRYTFGNENAAAAAKAGAKVLGQQGSMLPQQGNQFYGSTLPGPPPGLKSTGTPPVSGGGMFGQAPGFGNHAIGGGSNFGGAFKDNSNDLLRDIARNPRGGLGSAGGNHGHEAGKREYNFPTIFNPYPPSSTPAPPSGLLASLYGSQPGAFQDFGPKQKKKGKKHRHANTSSSGGGGLVDLADPSILQARMHQQQQQSNAGVGQGLFGSQAPDNQGPEFMDDFVSSIDALVADDTNEPPSYESLYAHFSRSSTPSVPPGLGLPHGHPSPAIPTPHPPPGLPHAHPLAISRPASIVQSERSAKPSPLLVSATLSQTPSRKSSTATKVMNASIPPTPVISLAGDKTVEAVKKETAAGSPLASPAVPAVTSRPTTSAGPTPLADLDEFPVLGKPKATKATPTTPSTPVKTSAVLKKTERAAKTETKAESQSEVKAEPKQEIKAESLTSVATVKTEKKAPGILNITTVSSVGSKPSSAVSTPVKATTAASFPPLPSSTTPLGTPTLARAAPKTLRVVPAAKTDLPASNSVASSPATSISHLVSDKSRQPSIALGTHRPGTPVSEIISEDASVASASISRANSPPPTKVGIAPVRHITKNQQKKQRREAMKEKEKMEAEAAAEKADPEPEVGPILGRKKKQKKEKVITPKPAASRASSPPPVLKEDPKDVKDAKEVKEVKELKEAESKVESPESKAKDKPAKSIKDTASKPVAKPEIKQQTEEKMPQSSPSQITDSRAGEPNVPSLATVFQELVASGAVDPSKVAMFKPTVPTHHRSEHNTVPTPQDLKLTLTEEDRKQLLANQPVRKVLASGGRLLLTPNGDCVRNLSEAEEQMYLELQDALSGSTGPGVFVPQRHHDGDGFTLVSGRAVPNGPASYFPRTMKDIDPIAKIQREEALGYINQYVIPSLSTNSQLEKALNAQALDSSASWSASSATTHEGSSDPRILTTGLEGLTADFTVGSVSRGFSGNGVNILSLEDAERALQASRKDTEKLEKSFNALLKKNRRLVLGSGH